MKIITWNVNGLRTLENFQKYVSLLDADILCLQETKISRSQLDNGIAKCPNYYSFFNHPVERQGHAGVATYVKKSFCPFFINQLDDDVDSAREGRVIASYHNKSDGKVLVIINVYVPCAYPCDEEKYEKKMIFLEKLKAFVSRLVKENKDVVVAGDLNVKSRIIDSAEAFENRNDPKFLAEWYSSPDKILFNSLLEDLVVDCQKYLHPNMLECYTCWNTKLNGRINNYGTRIDYILVSKTSAALIRSCSILSDVKGSDHCPFSADIDFNVLPCKTVPGECTLFYPELRGKQTSLSSMLSKRKVNEMVSNINPQNLDHHDRNQKLKKAKTIVQKQCNQTKLKFSVTHEVAVQKPKVSQSFPLKTDSNSNKSNSSNSVSVKSLLKGLPPAPLCSGHQLRSSLKTVTKDGPNFGKRFYCCSLTIGPSSSKSSRCNFFQWLDN